MRSVNSVEITSLSHLGERLFRTAGGCQWPNSLERYPAGGPEN